VLSTLEALGVKSSIVYAYI